MGRDLTLYPERATKSDLKELLENLNFHKCNHLWDWPEETLNYAWFETEDFKSFDGVSADIYPLKDDDIVFSTCRWGLHVRNLYHASYYDVEMLNHVLRSARKLYGGKITGDYGTNRYAPLWKDKSTPISRGIALIYENISQNMSKLEIAIPGDYAQYGNPTGDKFDDTLEWMKRNDPSRVLYNGLVPFAVSMFENFFQETFKVLIKYDKNALEYRKNYKQKLDFQELLEISRDQKTIEDFIASRYVFQNLDKLNLAYKDWLNIDIRSILYKKKRLGSKITFIEKRISDIINYRHGVIHHFYIDYSLDKNELIDILKAVKTAIDTVVEFLEKKYSVEIFDLI